MSEDSGLQLAVADELAGRSSVVAAHMGVAVGNGIVPLFGHVGSFSQKNTLHDAALGVRGVKAVAEDLKVKLAWDMECDDDDIAIAALERLLFNVSIPKQAVKVSVEDGWVTLSGEVDWQCQKEAAEGEIRPLVGVEGVINHITIKERQRCALQSRPEGG